LNSLFVFEARKIFIRLLLFVFGNFIFIS
jgi:hypothetical protein